MRNIFYKPNRIRLFRINSFIQLVIAIPVLIFIVYKILYFSHWDDFFDWLNENSKLFIGLIILQLVLSAFNIFTETCKWRVLTSILYKQSFLENLRQVLWGIQAGMITPAKTGEPVGKALLLKKGNRRHGLILSIAGSFFQNIVIVTVGLIALFVLKKFHVFTNDFFSILSGKIFYFAVLLPIIVILLLFVLYIFFLKPKKNEFFKRLGFYLKILKTLKLKICIRVLFFTSMRYIIFSFQLWITLFFFDIISAPVYIWLIPIYYLVITFIPTIALVDLGVRSSAALIIFGIVSNNTAGIIMSVFIIWLFNQVIPALTGIFIREKFFTNTNNYSN